MKCIDCNKTFAEDEYGYVNKNGALACGDCAKE